MIGARARQAAAAGGLADCGPGYEAGVKAATSELRIPADPAYIVVAKRAAAGFGCVAGFGVEALDDLCIAVAQACESAISSLEGAGAAAGQIRLSFRLEDQRLEVQVRSTCARPDEAAGDDAEVTVAEGARRLAARRERERALAERVAAHAAAHDLGLRVMGLFVDDCRYRVDERTGGLRVRLTKYRIS